MISIRILEAQNLPFINGHARKTIISCFSYSSYRFYIGSFTSKDKSTNPKWNSEFKIDLFRLINLRLAIFGFRANHQNYFLGDVTIHFDQFISKSPGNQIINSPGTSIRYEFPITDCKNLNAGLSLSFSYIPTIFRPIRFKKFSNFETYIHIWSSYSPSIESDDPQVEIELFQAINVPADKKGQYFSLSYFLDNNVSWESVGKSSLKQCFHGPTGHTQIHTLSLPQISDIYTFFILNVSTFSGKVSLHFIYESKTESKFIGDKLFIKPKKKRSTIGTLKVIEANVQPNTKYLLPFCMFYETKSTKANEFDFIRFGEEADMPVFDKAKCTAASDYTDRLNSEIEFSSQIIEKVHTIPHLSKMNFLRTNIFPNIESVSIPRILSGYNLQQEPTLRFYIGGSTTISSAGFMYINYWQQYFIGYDKRNGQICPEISKMYTSETSKNELPKQEQSYLPVTMDCNSILTLNLDSIGTDKVLVYCIFCRSDFQTAFPYGFFLISHLMNNSETLLFYNPIFVDADVSTSAVFFRIEYIENEWKIIPMKHYFRKRKEMEFCIESMHSNNWVLPPIMENKISDNNNNNDFVKSVVSKDSDDEDEYLMNENI